ncbi:15963_t:CDS:2 [Funneliformis caledonium]|uniref:15963_t:CDS:1 n=1 Tax=Funneliformis caledonium TaxID=1117310 RepID=A0A9N8ZIZ8_9GLOM|nr:15963_t:CDS:2 [Funneliformis caledonium]
MDVSLDEQFDINNVDWTLSKCKKFLRLVQEKPTETRIKKEPGDGSHLFLPMYLGKGREFYKWDSKNLHDIFVAIFRFLQKYYHDLSWLNLKALHKDKHASKEAKLQDKFIKEINDKWLPGFGYLYDFEYRIGYHKGDLIFTDDNGFLVAVETKRGGYNPVLIIQNINKAKEQAIKYRNLLMERTKNDSNIITILGVYFIDVGKKMKLFPLDIDNKIWEAIKKVHEFNKKSLTSDKISIAQTIGRETFIRSSQEADSDEDITDGLENTHL